MKPAFTFHFKASYASSLERQIREALAIENEACDNILNGKGEWGINLIPRPSYGDARNVLNRKGNVPLNSQTPQGASREPARAPKKAQQPPPLVSFESQYTARRKRRRIEMQDERIKL